MRNICSLFFIVLICLWSCESPLPPADMAIIGGKIYTLDDSKPTVSAVLVRDGRIYFTGSESDAQSQIGNSTKVIDLEGKIMTPGLIESHAHLMGLGEQKSRVELAGLANYEALVEKVAEAVAKAEPGEWIIGRGWHQSKWVPQPEMVVGYQTHEALSAVSPNNPVYLTHASGHAAFANTKAMKIAGITATTSSRDDGEVIKYPDGRPTGIFTESAAYLIAKHIPEDTDKDREKYLQAAIDECLRNGITSFQDAGSDQADIDLYQSFVDENKLGIRLWVMLSGGDSMLLKQWYERGPLVDNESLTVRAIKLYADGALGSRGAWLLEPYEDREHHVGNPIMPIDYIGKVAHDGLANGFQVCTHAIGDRANREVLDRYEAAFEANPSAAKDHRYRVEHAQHLHPEDIPRFSELGIIASMQSIHMSSDRPWAIDRLGQERIEEGAYVWQKLLQSGAKVINGTDSPVEPVSPIACYYAAISRKTLKGTPEGGYEAGQKMSREQALRTYTLDAAYGGFQENEKGSIEVGKYADFTVLSQDILTVPEDQVLKTEVVYTIVGGEIKYEKK